MDTVREFLAGSLTAAGGVVEEDETGLHVLLPAEEATRLSLPEEARIALDASPDQGGNFTDGRLGSPLLERLLRDRLATPPLAAVALPAELPRPLPDNLPVLLNAVRCEGVEQTRWPRRYLDLALRLTLQGDELRSIQTSLCLRLEDGAYVMPLPLAHAYPVASKPLDGDEDTRVRNALQRWLQIDGHTLLASALESVARRARRDLERMADYYSSLDAEMARAVQRARSFEDRARRQAKRATLADDLVARRAQLRDRFKPRLSGRLIAAKLIETEVDRFGIRVRRRSRAGKIAVVCRAGDRVFEGPACAACAAATLKLYLCDERLHVLCERCGRQGRLDPARCAACRRSPPARAPALSVDDRTTGLRLGE